MAFFQAMIVSMLYMSSALNVARTAPRSERSYTISGDMVLDETMNQAKAGSPVHINGSVPFPSTDQWRAELGDRIVRAASAKDAMRACGEFFSFGDDVFCKKAMPAETETAKRNRVYSGRNYIVKQDIAAAVAKSAPRPDEFIALSYGIEGGDLYSEIMSSNYGVKTKLFDCYYNGPHGPAATPAVNLTSSTPCTHRNCYSAPYEMNRVCLDESFTQRAAGTNGRLYEPLSAQLKDRKPLSVFLKMDVEGAEWATLRKLLDNDDDMAKLRTLNFEFHFNMGGPKPATKESLSEMVGIIEKLSKRFAVTGSTVELLHRSVLSKLAKGTYVKNSRAGLIFTSQGVPLDQYCISFVNKKLL
jgi:hypothetical protein